MTNSDFSEAKIGDKVWDVRHGHGRISQIKKFNYYPILVTFDNITCEQSIYLMNGKKAENDAAPSLFHEKPECFKTRVKKTEELHGWYHLCHKTFTMENPEQHGYVYAKAVMTYEVKE